MAKKNKQEKNWEHIQNQDLQDSVRYRDVYGDQQLERSRIQDKQSMRSRQIITAILAVLFALAIYFFISLFSYVGVSFNFIQQTPTSSVTQDSTGGDNSSTNSGSTEATEFTGDVYYGNYSFEGYKYKDGPITKWQEGGIRWFQLDASGKPMGHDGTVYEDVDDLIARGNLAVDTYENVYDVPVPEWYAGEAVTEEQVTSTTPPETSTENENADVVDETKTFAYHMRPTFWKIFWSIAAGLLLYAAVYPFMIRNLEAQNLMNDTADINQYQNDQHIALPEEVQRKFDWFPDVGAHCNVQVSSMISHVALQNKGLKKVQVSQRAKEDIRDDDGDVIYLKGEILQDDDGNTITKTMPLIDEKFMDALFEASGSPDDKRIRKYYDATQIPYNPEGKDRTKQGGKHKTVADMINADWVFPEYEPQRPAGAYLVDTEPVNTMVLAITRAGKGQTVIEPTLDMWTRELRPNNMVVNDPKGELLVKYYVRATVRGFQIVQFNLINAMKTDIYNPLAMAADSAKEGDRVKCAQYIENIADVFFPLDGGDDPVWPNAANNAFKRAAYGLIDYYLEEEKELRLFAERTKMDAKILDSKIDQLWGKVTLYNCYQLFVQLTSKKLKNPAVEFTKKAKAGELDHLSDDEYNQQLEEVEIKSKVLWEDKPETDLLTLYFNATAALPRNSMRTLVGNANDALRAMAGAEKMMASVYGIAITAMSFFTDPTISTLTSGTPTQNVDLAGLSFPRRLGVRFASDFTRRYHLVGMQAKWSAYEDKNFTKDLGKDFYHDDLITREGWARYYFKGIFPKDIAYVKLQIVNPQTGVLIRSFYFQFKKSYQTSLDGRYFIKDPVLETKIVKNGILTELLQYKDKTKGTIVYRPGKTTFPQIKIRDIDTNPHKEKIKASAIIQNLVRYSEKPKMVFLVTPPHLMKYAKLILILLTQLVNLNFDQSYMTKSDQKPLYKTRFMLDELGNLQSEGHGIANFQTMLSIGLGQEQQFTLILQTLQQLRDVYGDSVDKIVQGNVSNIVFLKSTDDSMLDTLQKMSGTTHRSYTDSKTITRDTEAIFKSISANEGKVSYTMTTREVPVISYNDMAFISERNSIVFRAGDSPIWNRNETILPMSWRLFKDTITQPGKNYTLQTIPTLSSALEFDVRKNQPDFGKMLEKRMKQAVVAEQAKTVYQEVFEYSDYQIEQLDPDDYSDDIMIIINSLIRERAGVVEGEDEEDFDDAFFDDDEDIMGMAEDNTEQLQATADVMAEKEARREKKFAGNMLSPEDLVNGSGIGQHQYDNDIVRVYTDIKGDMWNDRDYFTVRNGDLCGTDGTVYIRAKSVSSDLAALNEAAKEQDSRVFSEGDVNPNELKAFGSFEVTDAFYQFLAGLESWRFAKGKFEQGMKRVMMQ